MPTYIGLYKWTDQGIKNVKDSVTRSQQAQAAFEKSGAKVIGIYWTQGPYDIVTIGEWPDEDSAMAAALSLAKQGNVQTLTLRAFSAADMQRIMAKVQ